MIGKLRNPNNFLRLSTKNPRICFSYASKKKEEAPKRTFCLSFKYVEDFYYKRIPYREQHMKEITRLEEKGIELFGGSYFPMTDGCIIFRCAEEEVVKEFIKNDVYVKNGLIKDYDVQELEVTTKTNFEEFTKRFTYK